ncbi:TrpR-like protein YerC/YecD [bacterium]|nr:TrpR-like protein YerC/YecD [bacterium]
MDWSAPHIRALVTALQVVRSRNEMRAFLSDLMTEEELTTFAKRLQAADMLNESVPYTLIQKETGLSSATVARVAKKLLSEAGGYRAVLSHINPLPLSKR